jgi:hypothetical protein
MLSGVSSFESYSAYLRQRELPVGSTLKKIFSRNDVDFGLVLAVTLTGCGGGSGSSGGPGDTGGSPVTIYAATGGGLAIMPKGGTALTNIGLAGKVVKSVWVTDSKIYAAT